MWTMPDDGKGGWVLFRDGHVEYVEYPGRFPMTAAFVKGLEEVSGRDELSPATVVEELEELMRRENEQPPEIIREP